ncbi:MAG: hypothetical protein OXU26_03400 [Acidobacteriota bacterium]|nr:hypothetical protein [Acidobacteriota bacterium]
MQILELQGTSRGVIWRTGFWACEFEGVANQQELCAKNQVSISKTTFDPDNLPLLPFAPVLVYTGWEVGPETGHWFPHESLARSGNG